MKKLLAIFCLVLSLPAQAAVIPDCWDAEGVKPGFFAVSLELDHVSKKELIRFLAASTGHNIIFGKAPRLTEDGKWLSVTIKANESAERAEIEEEIASHLPKRGVTVKCESDSAPPINPSPRMGTGNDDRE